MALPMASPVLPCQEAMAETRISGAEVPRPTIVSPIIRGETFRLNARALAPVTKRSALQVSRTNPPAIASNSSHISE